MKVKSYDCGIDLGTTNSCIAISSDLITAEVIDSTTDNMSTTPSAVYITGKGKMIVGQSAYIRTDTDNLALQFKRLMGTDSQIEFKKSGIKMLPEELSAEVLKKVANDMATRTGKTPKNVVITIPAAFEGLQKEATIKAGEMAGFERVLLLQEPIAAAIAYGVKPEAADKNWMVFDFGGGTLDVAIISTHSGYLKVINSDGDNLFGGCDVDQSVLEKVILPRMNLNPSDISSSLRSALLKAEEVTKKNLGDHDTSQFSTMGIEDDDEEELDFECVITKEEVEMATLDIIKHCIEVARKALAGSNLEATQIEKILLVGGSTYLQCVRSALEKEFGVPIDSSVNPMHAVALGAALYAAGQTFKEEEEEVVDEGNKATVELMYNMKTKNETEPIMGKISNASVTPVYMRFNDSEKVEINNKGVFRCTVNLELGNNDIKLRFFDENEQEIPATGQTELTIFRNENVLKVANAPMTHAVGVGVMRDGIEQLDIILEKNTVTPASNKKTYKLNRPLAVGSQDSIEFKIYEGEIYDNPMANSLAGIVHVRGTDIKDNIKEGSEVELDVSVDENGEIHVSGVLYPQFYRIPETSLLTKDKVNLERKLDELENMFTSLEISARKVQGENDEYGQALLELKESYDSQYDLVDEEPGLVYKYIKRFYDVQTHFIRKERALSLGNQHEQIDVVIRNVMSWANSYAKGEDLARAQTLAAEALNERNISKKEDLKQRLTIFVDHVLENSQAYYVDRGNQVIRDAQECGAIYDGEFLKYKNNFEQSKLTSAFEPTRDAVKGMQMIVARMKTQNEEPVSEGQSLLDKVNVLLKSVNLNRNSDRVNRAIAELSAACESGDVNKLKEIYSVLESNMIDSAGEVAGKRTSDLFG